MQERYTDACIVCIDVAMPAVLTCWHGSVVYAMVMPSQLIGGGGGGGGGSTFPP